MDITTKEQGCYDSGTEKSAVRLHPSFAGERNVGCQAFVFLTLNPSFSQVSVSVLTL